MPIAKAIGGNPIQIGNPVQNRTDFIGPVYFGSSGNQTGLMSFWNASSYKSTSFQAGNATADAVYTFPTALPAGNDYLLAGSTTGTLSWLNGSATFATSASPTFTGTVSITQDNTVTLLALSGSNPANDLGAQAINTASDGATFWSAYNGSVSSVLACFGPTYSGNRGGQPAANCGVLEVAGGALIISTNNAYPIYFGANGGPTAMAIDTSHVVTIANAPVLSALTASTVPYINSGKALASSSVTPTELGYLSGVTSAVQTQIGTKAPTASPTFTGQATFAAGSVVTPSLTVGASNTGICQGSTNARVAVALGGTKAAEFYATGTNDATLYQPFMLYGGNGGSGVEFTLYSQAAITTAKQIAQVDSGVCLMLVYGTDGSNNDFGDLIFVPVGSGVAPTVITSMTSNGTPATRTYTKTGVTTVNLAMSSGTYATRTFSIDLAPR